jgi:predicted transcriptional regulator
MDERDLMTLRKNLEGIKKDLEAIKHLLALQLKTNGVNVTVIGKAMNVSQGRVSQILGEGKKGQQKKPKQRKSSAT